MTSAAQGSAQLEAARSLALGDGRYYPTIIPGVLPIIRADASPSPEVLRWGSDFLAETFASPTWPSDAKEGCSLTVLPVLKDYLDADDAGVVKSAIQAAASIYPLVYRHMYVQLLPNLHVELQGVCERELLNISNSQPMALLS